MSLRSLAARLAKLRACIKPALKAPKFCVQFVEPAQGDHRVRVVERLFIPSRVFERVTAYAPDGVTPIAWARVDCESAAVAAGSPSKNGSTKTPFMTTVQPLSPSSERNP